MDSTVSSLVEYLEKVVTDNNGKAAIPIDVNSLYIHNGKTYMILSEAINIIKRLKINMEINNEQKE